MSGLESELTLEEQRELVQKIINIADQEIRIEHNDKVRLERTKEIEKE